MARVRRRAVRQRVHTDERRSDAGAANLRGVVSKARLVGCVPERGDAPRWDGARRSIAHDSGKWLAGCYALLAGVVFLVLAGVMLAPVIHHVLQRFHLEADDGEPPGQA